MDCDKAWAPSIGHIGNFRNWKDPDWYQRAFRRVPRRDRRSECKSVGAAVTVPAPRLCIGDQYRD